MPEQRRFLRGMVAWVGFEQVPDRVPPRRPHAGRGASYRRCSPRLEAITSFSDVPLALATLFGIVIARSARSARS